MQTKKEVQSKTTAAQILVLGTPARFPYAVLWEARPIQARNCMTSKTALAMKWYLGFQIEPTATRI